MDLRPGVLMPSGKARLVTFDLQIVGTVRETDQSREWGWNNPGVPPALLAATCHLRVRHRRRGLRDFDTGMLPVRDPRLPWLYSAVAPKECGALGVYRGDGCGPFFQFPHIEPARDEALRARAAGAPFLPRRFRHNRRCQAAARHDGRP
jgi:hypothetical protein